MADEDDVIEEEEFEEGEAIVEEDPDLDPEELDEDFEELDEVEHFGDVLLAQVFQLFVDTLFDRCIHT